MTPHEAPIPQRTKLLVRLVPHERCRVLLAWLAPPVMTIASVAIAFVFGEAGGYRGENAIGLRIAVTILFLAQMPVWSFKFGHDRPYGALITLAEIPFAFLAWLFALMMLSREWL